MTDELAPASLYPDTWTVKEVVADLKTDLIERSNKQDEHLNKQDLTLEDISRKVDSKADKADLVVLGTKIDSHGQRITTLEQHRLEQLAARQFRNKVWAVAGSVGGILAILAGSLIAVFVHP